MNKPTNSALKKIAFKDAWQYLSTSIGSGRLPINDAAKNIHQFLISSDDQLGFMKDVIKQSYKQNHCNHLNSPIEIEVILDVLGQTAYELRHNNKDDLVLIELLEEIAWLLVERFAQYLQPIEQKATSSQSHVDIISLPQYRINKASTKS